MSSSVERSRPSHRNTGPRHLPFSQQRFAVLFAFLLVSLVVYPYAESSTLGYFAFRVLSSAIIVLTVYALAPAAVSFSFSSFLPFPRFHHILLTPSSSSTPALIGRVLSLCFDLVVIVIIFRFVFKENEPSSETIFGALCIYLLVGYAFASIYGVILGVQPSAFFLDPALNQHTSPDRFDLIYFSFGTMTELGTPGITALSREVRSVSLLEAVIGILYLAVLISRLLSAYNPTALRRSGAQDEPLTQTGEPPKSSPASVT